MEYLNNLTLALSATHLPQLSCWRTPRMKQSLDELTKLGFTSPQVALPRSNQRVIAVTSSFRCLAMRDENGKWRSATNGKEITGVIAWSPLQPDKHP